MRLDGFDEGLDGDEWCLKDYIRRAETKGYHSCVTARPELLCGKETVFGSPERRQEQSRLSRDQYLSRWGASRHFCLYFGKDSQGGDLSDSVERIVAAARHGHRFTLLLHRKQFKEFRKRGWHGLHTGITIVALPMFGAARALARQLVDLQSADPAMILLQGAEAVHFTGSAVTSAPDEIAATQIDSITSHLDNLPEVI
jgi:hypothetical protein